MLCAVCLIVAARIIVRADPSLRYASMLLGPKATNQQLPPRSKRGVSSRERAQQTTIFRLRTGHCGLSAHLKRIGISDTSLCECGQADQTPDHVLQSCPKCAERRQLTCPQGADLATKLWGSAEDLYRTAGFVASTGLKI